MDRRIYSVESTDDVINRARLATFMAFEEYAPDARAKLYELQKLFTDSEREAVYTWLRKYGTSKDFLAKFPYVSQMLDQFLHEINMQDTGQLWFTRICQKCLGDIWRFSPKYSIFPPFPSFLFGAYDGDLPETLSSSDEKFHFESLWAFDPSREKEADYRRNIQIMFEDALISYTSRIKDEALRNKKSIKYSPRGLKEGYVPKDAIHLIRYQVLREKFEEIAANPSKSFKAENSEVDEEASISGVTKGVNRFAALVGVTLRIETRAGQKQHHKGRIKN